MPLAALSPHRSEVETLLARYQALAVEHARLLALLDRQARVLEVFAADNLRLQGAVRALEAVLTAPRHGDPRTEAAPLPRRRALPTWHQPDGGFVRLIQALRAGGWTTTPQLAEAVGVTGSYLRNLLLLVRREGYVLEARHCAGQHRAREYRLAPLDPGTPLDTAGGAD